MILPHVRFDEFLVQWFSHCLVLANVQNFKVKKINVNLVDIGLTLLQAVLAKPSRW